MTSRHRTTVSPQLQPGPSWGSSHRGTGHSSPRPSGHLGTRTHRAVSELGCNRTIVYRTWGKSACPCRLGSCALSRHQAGKKAYITAASNPISTALEDPQGRPAAAADQAFSLPLPHSPWATNRALMGLGNPGRSQW